MNWNDHSKLAGKHALLSPSNYHWLHYDKDETNEALYSRYLSKYSQDIGTIVHEFACKRIKLGQLYPDRMMLNKRDIDEVFFYLVDKGIPGNAIDLEYFYESLLYYVNDGIGYRMDPEVVLYYSDNCYGTTDSIRFDTSGGKKLLRIHDFKSGKTIASMEQLQIYAALFCLEYGVKPRDIDIELRIYQPDNMATMHPDVSDIVPIMDKIVSSDKFLIKIESEGILL